jgi:hypothetical protein
MGRLQTRLLGRDLGVVHRLGAQVALVVGDPPEPEAPGEVLLVKLQVRVVAGVPVLAAPHLEGGPRIAEERDRLALAAPRGYPVGAIGRARLAGRHRLRLYLVLL